MGGREEGREGGTEGGAGGAAGQGMVGVKEPANATHAKPMTNKRRSRCSQEQLSQRKHSILDRSSFVRLGLGMNHKRNFACILQRLCTLCSLLVRKKL
jgi:hypothetical protein